MSPRLVLMVTVKLFKLGFSDGGQILERENTDQGSLTSGLDGLYLFTALNLLLAFLILGGCDDSSRNGPPAENSRNGPPAENFQAVSTDSVPSVVDIIVDATPSMQGFLQGFSDSPEYQYLVSQSLANASLSGSTVKYHRLSTAIPGGMSEVENKVQVTNQSFYNRGDTKLERAIGEVTPDRLVVLVTDLFQTNADMNQVAEELARRVLEKKQAVGLFGVRLPFEGRIYDLPFGPESFLYKGERPLYGLVLGSPWAVSQYFDNLRRYIDPSAYHFLLLSPKLGLESGTLQSVDSTENLVQVAPSVIPRLPNPRYLSFRIRDNSRAGRLNALLETNELPDARPLLEAEGIGVRTADLWKYDAQKEKYIRSFPDSASAAEALTADVRSAGSEHRLQVEVQPQDLRSGTYCYNLVVGVDRWMLPEWVSNWNLPPSEFQDDKPDGAKTANLNAFLLNLASSVTGSNFPQIATLQVFVEKSP